MANNSPVRRGNTFQVGNSPQKRHKYLNQLSSELPKNEQVGVYKSL